MPSAGTETAGCSGIAIDLGGTKLAAARIEDGRIAAQHSEPTRADAGAKWQCETILDRIRALEPAHGETIGVALAGRIDDRGVWHAVNRGTLKDVDGYPMRDRLERSLNRPVRVLNDALAAAIGEYSLGAGQGARSMAYITVSTGIGGGILLDGRPLVSQSGLAGHIGFTTVRDGHDLCGSGRRGTIESIASGRAISAAAAATGRTGMDARAVYDAHLDGEDWATRLIRRSAAAVAELSANLKVLFDVDRIVLGGSIGLADTYLELVEEALEDEPPLFRPPMVRAALGAESALIGALCELSGGSSRR